MSESGTKLESTTAGVVETSVELGRDARSRPFRREVFRPWRKRFQCVCCGRYTLHNVDYCDICPRCGWEDWYECHDEPDREIRPNYVSLNAARRLVQEYGVGVACQVNMRNVSVDELKQMTAEELAALKSLDDR
jgi:hypothetical protein